LPPVGGTRYLGNEVVVQLGAAFTPDAFAAFMRELGFRDLSQQPSAFLGRRFYRSGLSAGHSVRHVINVFERIGARRFLSVQPSYVFRGQFRRARRRPRQSQSRCARPAGAIGAVRRIQLGSSKRTGSATGRAWKTPIDSEIDADTPTCKASSPHLERCHRSDQSPHSHGPRMAGAIGCTGAYSATAPGARLLAGRASASATRVRKAPALKHRKGLNGRERRARRSSK